MNTVWQTPIRNASLTFAVLAQVTNGIDVVKKIEARGTELGTPRGEVKVVDSGSL